MSSRVLALLFGVAGERDDVGALEHRAEIDAARAVRQSDDVQEVRTCRVDDVVVPVGFEEAAVGGEVALVGGDAVGAVENGEEIRQQIDQHFDQVAGWGARRGFRDAE